MNNFDNTNQQPFEHTQGEHPHASTPFEQENLHEHPFSRPGMDEPSGPNGREFPTGFGGFGDAPHGRHHERPEMPRHGFAGGRHGRGARMGFGGEFPGGRGPEREFGPRRGGFGGPDWGEGRPEFGAGFGPHGGGRRGPGRGRKGDVRAAIIALLGEQPMNGYQLISGISEKSNGLWSPSAGSVYPALGLLEDEGLIAPSEVDGKKLFHLTDAGKAYAEEHADQVQAPWERVAGPHMAMLDLRPELHQLNGAVQQLAMSGQDEQVDAARDILVKARQNIYRLLAGDTPQD